MTAPRCLRLQPWQGSAALAVEITEAVAMLAIVADRATWYKDQFFQPSEPARWTVDRYLHGLLELQIEATSATSNLK